MSAQLVTDLLFEAKPRWSGTIGSGGVAAAGTTTIPLASAANLDNGDAYIFVINRVTSAGVKNELSEMETAIGELSGTNFINCVRGTEGTAQAWDAGIVVEILFTATHWNKLITAWEVAHNQDGTHKSGSVFTLPQINDTSADHQYVLAVSELTADRTITLPLLTGADEFMFQAHGLTTSANSNFTYHGLARQAIINGNFVVNQRVYVSNATLAVGNYGHDRWKGGASGGDYTFTQLPSSTTITIKTGKSLIQVVEDKNVIGGSYTLSWTGTAQARFGINSATPSGAYAASPITISTQTAGTVMSVEFNEGTLGEVQLNLGSVALPFQPKSEAQERADCQRYCWVISSASALAPLAIGYADTSTRAFLFLKPPVKMRTQPSAVTLTTGLVLRVAGGNIAITANQGAYITDHTSALILDVASGLTSGQAVMLVNPDTTTRTLTMTAEL